MFSICIWLGKTFLKFFGDNFLFPAQNISCYAQLYCVRQKIF